MLTAAYANRRTGTRTAQNFSVFKTTISIMRFNFVISPSFALRPAHWGEASCERDLILCVERLSRTKGQSWGKDSTAQ
jgi:hypothetical protein